MSPKRVGLGMEQETSDYSLRTQGDAIIVRLKATNLTSVLDVNRISTGLNELIDTGTRKIVLDLKDLQYAGSAALGMMMSLGRKMEELKGHLVLCNTEQIRTLFQVTRTAKLFKIAETPAAAIAMMAK